MAGVPIWPALIFTARPGNFATGDVSKCASTTPPVLTGSAFPDILLCGLPAGSYRVALMAGYDTACLDTVQFVIGGPDSVANPVVSLATGTYSGNQTVSISSPTSGATIYYTLNGNKPNLTVPNSFTKVYTGPILVAGNLTLRTIAAKNGVSSGVEVRFYTITDPQVVAAPEFSLPGGTYSGLQTISLSSSTPGASIWFTTNGTVPVPNTPNALLYNGPVSLGFSATIRAIGVKEGYAPSAVSLANYVLNGVQTVAAPTFNPPPGTFASPQGVTISCSTPGAQILYTTNGQTPRFGLLDARVYSTPVNLSQSKTLKARAFLAGMVESPVVIGNYTIGAARQAVNGEDPDYFLEPGSDAFADENAPVSVFPNPSQSGVFTLSRKSKSQSTITVSDIQGRVILRAIQDSDVDKTQLDLSKSPSGIYLLQIDSEKTRDQMKLLKP